MEERNNKDKEQLIIKVFNAAMETKITLFQISITLDMTIADILDIVDNNKKLKNIYNRYVMTMKDYYLNWAVNEKQKDLYTTLMSEIGVIDGDAIGNDLDLNIIVGDSSDLKIGTLDDLNVGDDDEEKA